MGFIRSFPESKQRSGGAQGQETPEAVQAVLPPYAQSVSIGSVGDVAWRPTQPTMQS